VSGEPLQRTVGLCAACAHARAVVSGRGSTFWLCGLNATDSRYARYPRLPVTRCPGFAPGSREASDRRGAPSERDAPEPTS
jgi:hypothetical protein